MTSPLENGTVILGVDGTVHSISRTAARILGISPDAPGRAMHQLLADAAVAARGLEELPAHAAPAAREEATPVYAWIEQHLAELQRAPESEPIRGTLLLPEGHRLWCKLDLLCHARASNGASRPKHVVLTVARPPARNGEGPDLDEALGSSADQFLLHQEQRLRSNEAKYRLLAEHAHDVIWTMDNVLNLTYVSPAVKRMHGFTPAEARAMDWQELVKPSSHSIVYEALERRRQSDAAGIPSKPLRLELEQVRHDGSAIWTEVIVSPLYDDDGIRLGYLGITRDISATKNALAALTRSARRTRVLHHLSRAMLDAAGTPVDQITRLALDHLQRLVPHKHSSVVVFDYEHAVADVIAARTPGPTPLSTGRRIPLSLLALPEGFASRPVWHEEDVRNVPLEQRWAPVLLKLGLRARLSAPLVVEGRLVGMLNVGADQPRAFADEHVEIVREVADLVALALSQTQYERDLVAAKERAEEADRLKSTFLANMSHEIRTPLTAIMGFADIMRDELKDEMKMFADHVHQGGQRLLDTLESVMQFSRLEAGQMQMRPAPTDLTAELHRTVARHERRAKERQVHVAVDTELDTLNGAWDQRALRDILDSLVDNAIKFTPPGGTVRLRAWSAGHEVHCCIEDTGIGIDPDAYQRIFTPFVQESEGLGRSHEGSGLGLAIVQRLTRLMGGRVAIESQKGEGTTVTVIMPLRTNAGVSRLLS